MSFSAKLYWKRRLAGKRGQVDKTPEPKLVKASGVRMYPRQVYDEKGKRMGSELVAVNRPARRRKIVDRKYNKAGYKGHAVADKQVRPTYPPQLTNKQRLLERRAARKSAQERQRELAHASTA